MKQVYILILLSFISCVEKAKEKEGTVKDASSKSIQSEEQELIAEEEAVEGKVVEYKTEDISGEYELIDGKTHIIGDEGYDSYKSALVIERLSENDFGYYLVDKIKDITPLGDLGVFRRVQGNFYQLAICKGKDIEGFDKDNFTNGLYLHNQVFFHQKGDSLGIVQYGGNFRKYMLYQKRKSNMHTSLIRTMKKTKQEYQDFLVSYEKAKNYDITKLQIEQYFNGEVWQTEHRHQEDDVSFEKTFSYQDPYQEGKFLKQDEIFENRFLGRSFNEIVNAMYTRKLPIKETTNFDDFHEVDDVKKVNAKVLQLQKIYPNYFKEDSSLKAIRTYRIALSDTFYTIVVTMLKGEHEMESVLVNYNTDGTIIDSKVISYDEIAEGMFKIESRIESNQITRNSIADLEEKNETIETFKIDSDGKIETTPSGSSEKMSLTEHVIEQLNLDATKIKTELVVSKMQPNNSNETILVIPEIAVEPDEQHFELNSHIVLVNNTTKKITHRYSESFKTNGWTSDAIQLKELKIDTAPYTIAENMRAFGVRVYYYGSSKANPYSNETISLFVKSGDMLKKILNNFDVMNYGGEWDTDCSGEFVGSKATLSIFKEKTNGYFDIVVKNTITETKNYEDDNGDCESKDKITTETKILKFDGNTYKLQ